jgi:hypothetical protein
MSALLVFVWVQGLIVGVFIGGYLNKVKRVLMAIYVLSRRPKASGKSVIVENKSLEEIERDKLEDILRRLNPNA